MPIGVPSVPFRLPGSQYERWIDIYTRLSQERIIFLGQEVNDSIANRIVAFLLYLDSDDPSKPIYLYINSPKPLTNTTTMRRKVKPSMAKSVSTLTRESMWILAVNPLALSLYRN